jgi:hypothetical protein
MTPSQIDLKPICLLRRSSIHFTKWDIDRPNLSNLHTVNVSPGFKDFKHASSPGLSVLVPETLSVKIFFLEHPAAFKTFICKDKS